MVSGNLNVFTRLAMLELSIGFFMHPNSLFPGPPSPLLFCSGINSVCWILCESLSILVLLPLQKQEVAVFLMSALMYFDFIYGGARA